MKLIIIGSGPGGYETALRAAQKGIEVILIDKGPAGGTCLHEGCIPTKCLCRNANLLNDLAQAEILGLADLSYSLDFEQIMKRKQQVVNNLSKGIETLLSSQKLIQRVEGIASFIDSHTITVNGQLYTADNIIIATGSETKYLSVNGVKLPRVLTSRELLDINHIPRRLCIIGAGVIGMEFASIFRSFGSEITVLEFQKEILPTLDTDITKRLQQAFIRRGIQIINQATVLQITSGDDTPLEVHYSLRNKEYACITDFVLLAVGRTPCIENLNLSTTDIYYTSKGIVTDDNMCTNVPHVYAIGDVNGHCMLAHAATYQGWRALNHMIGKPDKIRLDVIPAAIFTYPEAAMVGPTEKQCRELNINYTVYKSFFRTNGKAVSMGETEGMCKLLVDAAGYLIACHIYGPHAADLVQEISVLICKGTTINELQQMIHTHPTLGEILVV